MLIKITRTSFQRRWSYIPIYNYTFAMTILHEMRLLWCNNKWYHGNFRKFCCGTLTPINIICCQHPPQVVISEVYNTKHINSIHRNLHTENETLLTKSLVIYSNIYVTYKSRRSSSILEKNFMVFQVKKINVNVSTTSKFSLITLQSVITSEKFQLKLWVHNFRSLRTLNNTI